jgi:DNA-binding protein HU-beta
MTTKADLVHAIVKETGFTRQDAEKAFDACIKSFKASLAKGKKVSLQGFGTFAVVERKKRTARNPKTGETITVPAKTTVKFSPSKKIQKDHSS